MLSVQIQKKLGAFALDVAFEAEHGVMGILGPSGCGKSMTLRCIAGIERPDQGRITLQGITLFDSAKGIDLPPQKRRVGYLFQNYALFPHMTVEKNILCGLYQEKDPAKRRQQVSQAVRLLRLEGLEKRRPSQLSGGEQQRVALARILVNKPRLLMLDEPFSALDSHLRGQLRNELKGLLAQYDGAALMVTHSRDEVYDVCGRLALMDAGALLAVKPTKELFADPGSVTGAEITGCTNIAPAVKAGAFEIEAHGWGVRFQAARPVRDGLNAVGVRAHFFSAEAKQNRFPVRFTGETEEPFETILSFRYENQRADTPDLLWRMPKDRGPRQRPAALGISPEDVMPLY